MEKQFGAVTEWQRETFGTKGNPVSLAKHLIDEVIELRDELMIAKYVLSYSYDDSLIKKELADCFIIIFEIADKLGYTHDDLCKIIDAKLSINKQRKWNNPDSNGVIKHKEN